MTVFIIFTVLLVQIFSGVYETQFKVNTAYYSFSSYQYSAILYYSMTSLFWKKKIWVECVGINNISMFNLRKQERLDRVKVGIVCTNNLIYLTLLKVSYKCKVNTRILIFVSKWKQVVLIHTLKFVWVFSTPLPPILALLNPLKTNIRPLYSKNQFVPRSKHFSSRL